VHIVVLVKPVPDPASGGERLGADGRLDRPRLPWSTNREYAPEAALAGGASEGSEVARPDGAGVRARDAAQALAMGATRDPRDGPGARRLCAVSTAGSRRALPLTSTLVLAGVDVRPGGTVPAAVAAHLGLPLLPYAARIEPARRSHGPVRRISATGYDRSRPMLMVISCTQALVNRAIRHSRDRPLLEGDRDALLADPPSTSAVGGPPRRRRCRARTPPARAATEIVREIPATARPGSSISRPTADHRWANCGSSAAGRGRNAGPDQRQVAAIRELGAQAADPSSGSRRGRPSHGI
jgi:electron transfer flavoprotein alpha/beta subunit